MTAFLHSLTFSVQSSADRKLPRALSVLRKKQTREQFNCIQTPPPKKTQITVYSEQT